MTGGFLEKTGIVMSKRKQNFIDSAVQGQLVRRILLHWTAFFCVLMMCVVFMQMLLGNPEQSLTERMTAPVQQYLLLGTIMLSLLPAFMLDTVRFSNRFVGPVARLRKSLRELAVDEEDTRPLKFRDNDFWSDAAGEFNQVAEKIREMRKEIDSLKQKQEVDVA